MTTKRRKFDMIYLNQKVYAVGGVGGSSSRESMDIFDSATRRWTKQSIPFSVFSHCMTQLSANQFILIGGWSSGSNVTTRIYDVTTSSWTTGPSRSTVIGNHGCFHIKDSNVITKIVVMGGNGRDGVYLSSTEILDVNSMTWGTGPALPRSDIYNKGVQSESGTYLGFSIGGVRIKNKIYGLKKTSENGYTWEEVHSMTTDRYLHSAVNAPKSLLPNC